MKKAQAKNDMTSVSIAIKAFYNDYSRYPIPANKTDDAPYEPSKSADGNKEVMNILTAANAELNTKGIRYYEGKTVKDPAAPKAGLSDGGLFDPWGYTYGIVVDGDNDTKLKYEGSQIKDLTDAEKVIPGGVGVFSLGTKQTSPIRSW